MDLTFTGYPILRILHVYTFGTVKGIYVYMERGFQVQYIIHAYDETDATTRAQIGLSALSVWPVLVKNMDCQLFYQPLVSMYS